MTHALLHSSERLAVDAKRAQMLSQAINWIRQYPNASTANKAKVEINPTYGRAVDGAFDAARLLEDLIGGKLVDLWDETLSFAEEELATIEERYRSLLHPPSSE